MSEAGLHRARERQRSWDALLAWCSERGSGTWPALRAACGHLGLDAVEAVRSLAALGHLEHSWERRRWAAAPTCLVELERPAGRLLLTGAITVDLPDRLDATLAAEEVDAALLGPFPQGGRGPSTLHVECDEADWPEVARVTGLPVVPALARRLATLLPPADPEVVGVSYVPDERFPAAPLDPERCRPRWGTRLTAGRAAVQMLPHRAMVCWVRGDDGRARRLPSAEWAPYAAGDPAAAGLVRYGDAERTLTVSAAAPLPPLHARVACLCSGRLPGRAHLALEQAEDRYRAVPPEVARAIRSTLVGWRETA